MFYSLLTKNIKQGQFIANHIHCKYGNILSISDKKTIKQGKFTANHVHCKYGKKTWRDEQIEHLIMFYSQNSFFFL